MTTEFGTPLWTAREIACLTDGHTTGDWFAEALVTVADDVVAGDVFVACDRPDEPGRGHAAVAAALAAGAEGAVVSRIPDGLQADDARLIMVEDTDIALRKLAVAARQRMPGKLVAVAGHVGKTGVKEATARALGRNGPVHACNHRRAGAHACLVELANIPRATRTAVIEIDVADDGVASLLEDVIRPDVAAVVTLPVDANDAIPPPGYDRLIRAVRDGGALAINLAAAKAGDLARAAEGRGLTVITASLDDETAHIHPVRASFQADCTCLTVMVGDSLLTFKAGLPGRHWAANSLLVLGAVAAVGGDLGMAGLALAAMRPLPGRGAIRRVRLAEGELTVIDDSIESDPLSLKAAFDVTARIPAQAGGQRIAVLAAPDGGDSLDALRDDLTVDLAQARLTRAYVNGPTLAALCRAAGVPVETFDDVGELAAKLVRRVGEGDVVLIKGPGGAGLSRLVTRLMMRDLGQPEPAGSAYAPLAAE